LWGANGNKGGILDPSVALADTQVLVGAAVGAELVSTKCVDVVGATAAAVKEPTPVVEAERRPGWRPRPSADPVDDQVRGGVAVTA